MSKKKQVCWSRPSKRRRQTKRLKALESLVIISNVQVKCHLCEIKFPFDTTDSYNEDDMSWDLNHISYCCWYYPAGYTSPILFFGLCWVGCGTLKPNPFFTPVFDIMSPRSYFEFIINFLIREVYKKTQIRHPKKIFLIKYFRDQIWLDHFEKNLEEIINVITYGDMIKFLMVHLANNLIKWQYRRKKYYYMLQMIKLVDDHFITPMASDPLDANIFRQNLKQFQNNLSDLLIDEGFCEWLAAEYGKHGFENITDDHSGGRACNVEQEKAYSQMIRRLLSYIFKENGSKYGRKMLTYLTLLLLFVDIRVKYGHRNGQQQSSNQAIIIRNEEDLVTHFPYIIKFKSTLAYRCLNLFHKFYEAFFYLLGDE